MHSSIPQAITTVCGNFIEICPELFNLFSLFNHCTHEQYFRFLTFNDFLGYVKVFVLGGGLHSLNAFLVSFVNASGLFFSFISLFYICFINYGGF